MKNISALMLIVFVFFVSNCFFDTSAAPAVTYDQRQDGMLNVDVKLSNISVIAILGSDFYGDWDDDVSYDYTDFTLKPITSRPTSPAKPVEATTLWPTVSSTSATSTATSLAEDNNNKDKNDDKDKITGEEVAADSHDDSESANADDDESEPNTSLSIADLLQTALAEGIPLRITPSKKPISVSSVEPTKETIEETSSGSSKPGQADSNSSKETSGETNVKTGLSAVDSTVEKDPIADIFALVKPEESSSEENSSAVATLDENSEATNEQTDPPRSSKKCSPGYARNQRGQCRRLHGRRKTPASGLLPFGLRLTPRIHRPRDRLSETVEN